MIDSPANEAAPVYQVLARKYRPQSFADLIGQEAMVRTLKNAFAADRIAQAFIMTGIRGTGKTTTARIIAKGLNCIGPDGQGGPTTEPCGICEHCVAIAESRHVDVLEMDAASRTGVGDIREIIESVRYRAASARYKIYIIDEVHMLSTSAFNALLKTLEEPPAHVKFIFATTEIRKVPVTVLSRCQRFDLRRIQPEVMIAHLQVIAAAEEAKIADEALSLITRAAEGSVRDALSLLDQAIAMGAGETSAAQVRAMLGLADRGRVLDLFQMIMRGNAEKALTEIADQYAEGADPLAILRDLAEITHWISMVKINPETADDPNVTPEGRTRGQEMAAGLPMRALTRMWQMLLKAIEEVSLAPDAMMAAEMAIIRLTHVADLPDPATLIRELRESPRLGSNAPRGGGGAGTEPSMRMVTGPARASPRSESQNGPVMAAPLPLQAEESLPLPQSFEDVIALIRDKRDLSLLVEVERGLRLISYSPGRVEIELTPDADAGLPQRLMQRLQDWTGMRWGFSIAAEGGAPSIAEARAADRGAAEAEAGKLPLVQAILANFPGARISDIRNPQDHADDIGALPAVEADDTPDDWDPLEE